MFGLAVEIGVSVLEIEQWPLNHLIEWVAYYKVRDPKDREQYEWDNAFDVPEDQQTEDLFNFLRKKVKKDVNK